MATRSNGVAVTVNSIVIGGLTDASFSGIDVNNIDTTTHDDAARTFVGGLVDYGTLELSGKFDITDSGQLGLIADIGVTRTAVVTYADSGNTTATASVIVGGFLLSCGLDDTVDFTCSCKVSGALAIVA